MTDFRWLYYVGITSVLRRYILLILGAVTVVMSNAPAKADNANPNGFYEILRACISFQQSGAETAFDGLDTKSAFGKLCDTCSQTFGEFHTRDGSAVVKVSFLGAGDDLKVDCTSSGNAPPKSGIVSGAVDLWLSEFGVTHAPRIVPDEPWSVDACADDIVPYRLTLLFDETKAEAEALFYFHGRPRFEICKGAVI